MKLPFDISRAVLEFADRASAGTLSGVRDLLTGSMQWTAGQMDQLAKIAPKELPPGWHAGLNDAIQQLRAIEGGTGEALTGALEATGTAFEQAQAAVHLADDVTRRTLFENLQLSSVVGESFAGVIPTSKIQPSFRLITNGDGVDVDIDAVATDYVHFQKTRPGNNAGVVLCVPGLFCDEGLWEDAGISALLRDAGMYPVYLRFNPGAHISANGQRLLELVDQLAAHPAFANERFDAISYSQGGLVLRSMLYYDGARDAAAKSSAPENIAGENIAGEETAIAATEHPERVEPGPIARRLGRLIGINTPDGGSYLEKLGYWLGVGMQVAPIISLKAVGFIGNQRSDAIKDLSHGIIRESDWLSPNHTERYGRDYYFGELDAIDAYQIYSVISETDGPWESWLGDGIVEKSSLTLLSDRVYRAKANPDNRVHCLFGKSHFQVVQAPETLAIVQKILSSS
ncbi:MAG: alpha/beta hydrolase [bacterium]|nr:alpha/beta hydrolase [bacterium]